MKKALQLKRALRATLLVLLLNVVGMGNGYAQITFTVGDLNYRADYDGTTATVLGHVDGTSATGMLTIPETVTYAGTNYTVRAIGSYAFAGCSGFTGLTIGNSVESILDGAFSGCSGFTGSLDLPNSLTIIWAETFYGCSGFTGTLVIPNSVTSIYTDAFYGCSGFTGLTIGNSLEEIYTPFGNCSNIEQIVVEAGNTVYDSRNNCNCIIATEANALIAGCKNSVIPNGVVSILDYAFEGSDLTTITIPNSVTSIGYGAFSNCSKLTSMIIPGSVTSIDENVLSACDDLGQITIEESNPVYDSRDNCNCIIETATNMLISGCKNSVIPNSVTVLGNGAFYGCSKLTSIVIPSSVISIGWSVLGHCNGLRQITVEEGNPIYDSRNHCNAIIETSSNVLIQGCRNTVIPNSVTTIDDYAFYGCVSSETLVLPNTITTIGNMAFSESAFAGDLVIPNSVTTIGAFAFYFSGFNGSLILGNSVETIDLGAFGWSSFTGDLVIPSSVTTIGPYAFMRNGFESIASLAETPPVLGDGDVFYDVPCTTLTVPCGFGPAYEASSWFWIFNTIEEACDSHSISVANSTGGVASTSATSAVLGEEILVSYVAESGYELRSIIVCKADDETSVVPCNNNSFIMPNFDVVVKPTFAFTSVNENSNVAASVYPNPTKGIVRIKAENIRHISVFNELGQQVLERAVDGNEIEFDLAGQEAGTYLIRIETASGVATKRVVLSR